MRLLPENDHCQLRIHSMISKFAVSRTDADAQQRMATREAAHRLTEKILRDYIKVTEIPGDKTVVIEGEIFVFSWEQFKAEMTRAFEAGREDRMRYGP